MVQPRPHGCVNGGHVHSNHIITTNDEFGSPLETVKTGRPTGSKVGVLFLWRHPCWGVAVNDCNVEVVVTYVDGVDARTDRSVGNDVDVWQVRNESQETSMSGDRGSGDCCVVWKWEGGGLEGEARFLEACDGDVVDVEDVVDVV
eukprot:5518003-Amphidinium_carterae.6